MFAIFENELNKIESEMESFQISDIPRLFRKIPLYIFGQLLLDIPPQYPHMKAFFPTMASDESQDHWAGTHGETLLAHTLAFVNSTVTGYAAITGKRLENARILDFGCGWGRVIRLFYKFTSVENIYALDPWDESLKECEKHHVKGHLALSDYVPHSLPFNQKFDLIFALSIFTHLSEKTARIVLGTLRNYIAEDGVLAITIRPKEYWNIHNGGVLAPAMLKLHDETGFAFTPHNLPPIDGDITYGDTSISLAYFDSHYPQWTVQSVEYNVVDPYQIILFLKPT
jgi:SAM-dependent methyltransferase